MKKVFTFLLLAFVFINIHAQGFSTAEPDSDTSTQEQFAGKNEEGNKAAPTPVDCCKKKKTVITTKVKPKEEKDCGCTKLTCTQQDLTSGVCTTCAMAWKIFNCTDNSVDSLYFVQLVSHFNARTNTSFASQMELAGIFKNEVHIENRLLFAGQYEIGKRNSCTKEVEFMPITGAEQCNVFVYHDSIIAIAGNGNFVRRAVIDSVTTAAGTAMKSSGSTTTSDGDFLGIPQWVLRWIFYTAAGLIIFLLLVVVVRSVRSPQTQPVYSSNR